MCGSMCRITAVWTNSPDHCQVKRLASRHPATVWASKQPHCTKERKAMVPAWNAFVAHSAGNYWKLSASAGLRTMLWATAWGRSTALEPNDPAPSCSQPACTPTQCSCLTPPSRPLPLSLSIRPPVYNPSCWHPSALGSVRRHGGQLQHCRRPLPMRRWSLPHHLPAGLQLHPPDAVVLPVLAQLVTGAQLAF